MKLTKKLFAMLALLPIFALMVACGDDPVSGEDPKDDPTEQPGDKPAEEEYEDIKVVDGKVRFYLREKENSTRTATGMTARDWAKSKVVMNGTTYKVDLTDEETPRPYIEVAKADKYEAVLLTSTSNKWYETSAEENVKLPYSQFYHTAVSNIKSFPMYGAYSKTTGNKLVFNDGFAMIYIRLKGKTKITSVKVDSPTGKALAGFSNLTSKGEYTVKKGMDFAVLNCTNKGDCVQLSSSKYTNFRVMVAPGTYSKGLKVTICDAAHQAVFVDIDPLTLAAGDIYLIEQDYAPDANLCYYEGFDNFVWGGDIMKGSEGFGYAPTSESVTIDSSADLTGYEDAFAEVAYNNPGTGFVQSNTWSEVNGKSVAESHRMTDSYVASRNIADVNCMFRTQEHPGYIAIGAANTNRGIYASAHAAGATTIGRVKVTAQFALQAGFSGNLQVEIINGGVVESATVDGVAVDMTAANLSYDSNKAIFAVPNKSLPVSKSATEKQAWHTLEVVVNGATDGTQFYLADENSNSGVHGVYLNSVEIRQIEEWGKKDGTLRVLLWNVLCGMWQDQHNNYDNFVKWVKKYDPDICIWCESETTHKDQSTSSTSSKYLPDGWAQLCTRYGHTYAAVGGNRDNFPQTVTSKYPIKTVKKITDTDDAGLYGVKYVAHGAGHFTIEVEGKKINIVTLHMWPQSYAPGTSAANQAASSDRREGDYFREYEMQYIVNNTVNLTAHKNEEYWIFGGDTNSRSRLDAWYHKYADNSPVLLTHDVVRNQTNLKDAIGDYYPRNYFFSSTYASARIDILYLSPKMFDRIDNSIILIDEWCRPRMTDNVQGWYAPSDHRPVLIDFDMKK